MKLSTRATCAFVLWLTSATTSYAADGAELNILGFSADKHYFAFEQFGIQDGSGFAYSDIFVIDLKRDQWLPQSPIHVQAKDEGQAIDAIRKQSALKYQPLEKAYAISMPPQLLARNAATEVIEDRKTIAFDRWYLSSQFGSTPQASAGLQEIRYQLTLSEKPLPRPQNCPEDMGDFTGFTLNLQRAQPQTDRTVFADASLPSSRGCPLGYDIEAVVGGFGDKATDQLVAIVGVYSLGFEGKDLRYIAVPFTLSK
ncbi:MAG: DUF2259 domain-containing protein [Aestuariivirga sp.]